MMPHVDLDTGQIMGCKENTFSWFHEEGHLYYNSNYKTSRLNLLRTIFFDFWVVFTSLAIFFPLIGIISLILMLNYIGLGQYEEIWCNKYARQKLKELEEKDEVD